MAVGRTAPEVNVPKPHPGASIADPGPLGLAAFALTTFVLSSVNAGLVPKSVEPVVFGVALFYGGIVQLVAGIWEFVKGNTFGATAFCSYAGFWLAFWLLAGHTDLSKAGADASKGVGIFLLGWTIFTFYMTVAALRTTKGLAVVFILLSITFLLLTIGALGSSAGMTKAGGYFGLLTALGAWYCSFAGVANSTFGRRVLPTD